MASADGPHGADIADKEGHVFAKQLHQLSVTSCPLLKHLDGLEHCHGAASPPCCGPTSKCVCVLFLPSLFLPLSLPLLSLLFRRCSFVRCQHIFSAHCSLRCTSCALVAALRHLDLRGCTSLRTLPELPSTSGYYKALGGAALDSTHATGASPAIACWPQLKTLRLDGCVGLKARVRMPLDPQACSCDCVGAVRCRRLSWHSAAHVVANLMFAQAFLTGSSFSSLKGASKDTARA